MFHRATLFADVKDRSSSVPMVYKRVSASAVTFSTISSYLSASLSFIVKKIFLRFI